MFAPRSDYDLRPEVNGKTIYLIEPDRAYALEITSTEPVIGHGRWRCIDADCEAKTWTEHSDHVDAQAVLTRRAGAEACRQVGEEARPVSRVAA